MKERQSPPATAASNRLDPPAHPVKGFTVKLANVIQAKNASCQCLSCGSTKHHVLEGRRNCKQCGALIFIQSDQQ